MKHIAILTSGGDAPGMNAAVRAVTRKAIDAGLNVTGIEYAFRGIIEEAFIPLTKKDVKGIITRGGTILRTARFPEFKNIEIQKKAYHILQAHDIDCLVVIGGDGSMAGAKSLANLGMPTIVIPCTIDNDMAGTEYTLGFDTSVQTVLEAVTKIRDTSDSHERVAIVEVMGRHAGHIALQSALACGAEIVLVPEHPESLEVVCQRLYNTHKQGKQYSIIIVAEGAYSAYEVNEYIRAHTYFTPSVTVLGYIQRGGNPCATDSVWATKMGALAVDSILQGKINCLVGLVQGNLKTIPYSEVYQYPHQLNEDLYNLIGTLSS